MSDKVVEILEYGSEGYLVDFKQEEYPLGKYPKKHEFLKDISAMANHPKDEDKFIIIGAVEKNGIADSLMNIPNLTDQAKYQQYLNSNVEPQINFEYQPFKYKNYQLAYFRIFGNKERPYLFKEKVQIVDEEDNVKIVYREGDGFIRCGSETKKMIRSDFERIYKNRLIQNDRKSDIELSPKLTFKEEFSFNDMGFDLYILDLDVKNLSNKSLELDIEMKAFEGVGYKYLSGFDYQKMKNQNSNMYSTTPNIPNFRVSTKEHETYFQVEASGTVAQNGTLKDVFEDELLVILKSSVKIQVEITVRCDDFTEGALVAKFEVEI